MNFKKLTLAIVSTLSMTAALIGCNQGGSKEEATIQSMKLDGFSTSYNTESTIDWSKLAIVATYSNKKTTKFSSADIEFEAKTKESTKVVVYTSGLHEQNPLVEGEYPLSAAHVSKLDAKFDLGKVTVVDASVGKYDLVSFSLPTSSLVYQNNIANAGQDAESSFKQGEEIFTVGTLNTFKFSPIAVFRNKSTGNFESIEYKKVYDLKVSNGEVEVDAPESYYKVVDDGIKFEKAAAGKQFRLKVSPKDWAKTMTGTDAVVTFDFKVEEGLNVYTAKQLGALNLTHYEAKDFFGDKTFAEHYGINGEETSTNGTSDVFWNAEKSAYERIDYVALWKEFLADTFSAEELVEYQDVPAIFLQNDIAITVEDIPEEYFITENADRVGALRDDTTIYFPIVEDNDVVINGNYFSVNTAEIPLCYSTTAISGVPLYIFAKDYEGQVPPGHASLFKFCGVDPVDEGAYFRNQVDTANGHKGVIKNINTIGNTSVVNLEQNDKIMEVTGLIFGKNVWCGAEYTNNIIKQYQIAVFPDNMIGQPYGGHEQVDSTFIRYCKVFDCSNTGICNYHNGGALVEHSEFNRFGGAPVLNAGCEDMEYEGICTFGEDVVFNNFITGQEVYFTAVGASGQFAQLTAWNPLFQMLGNSFIQDGKMNLVALNMDGADYVFSSHREYFGEVSLNKYEGSEEYINCTVKSATNAAWLTYLGVYSQVGQYAPVFATEKGEIFFFNGVDSFINPSTFQPWTEQLQGTYLSILLPVGQTTLNAVFRIGKVSA